MGGKSKSSSSSSNSSTDNRVAMDASQGGIGVHATGNSRVNIQSLDTVALTTAADVVKDSSNNLKSSVADVLNFAAKNAQVTADATSEALNTGAGLAKSAMNNTLDASNNALNLADTVFGKAIGLLDKSITSNTNTTNRAAEVMQTAYADAKGQTQDNKYLVAGALAVVGIVGFTAAFRSK